MANGNDFKDGSPWGSPPGGRNGSGRGGRRPPSIDEVIEKIQKLISKLMPGGNLVAANQLFLDLFYWLLFGL